MNCNSHSNRNRISKTSSSHNSSRIHKNALVLPESQARMTKDITMKATPQEPKSPSIDIIRWTPHPAIVTTRDDGDYTMVLVYS